MNIILIIIDTLRHDHIGSNGLKAVHTPNLNRFAAMSRVYDNAFAASFPTIPHRTDVMTGRTGSPFHAWLPLRFDAPALPRLLEKAGYCTQLIHDTPHLVNGGHAFDYPFHGWTFVRGAEVDRPWIDGAGFEYLENWADDPFYDYMGDAQERGNGDITLPTYSRANRGRKSPEDWNAAKLFGSVSRFLQDNASREKFFLWVDCFDPHEPWDAPPEFVWMYGDSAIGGKIDPRAFLHAARNLAHCPDPDEAARRYQQLYAAKVSWMDACFGKMLDTLEDTGLMKNTAILVTSDHGTNVGERGIISKSFPVREQEGHVPLMLYYPGCAPARLSSIAQPQDIFATILSLAGSEPDAGAEGFDLLNSSGQSGSRTVALAGGPPTSWGKNTRQQIFTVFSDKDYLTFAPEVAACRLYRYGVLEDVTASDPSRVAALRAMGLEELARRGTPLEIIEWLRNEGNGVFPEEKAGRRADPGWRHYFMQNYSKW